MNIKELGRYQWEWLNKYGTITLNEWRYEYIDNIKGIPISVDWYYVGIWNPTKKDGGYQERRNNLKQNPYHYWPT